jgi:LmbE family N-acetylglucosaminyl deacetylase
MVTGVIEGAGTSEATWLPWLDEQPWRQLDLGEVAARRVVVLAAHPDDEVLGVGGLISTIALRGNKIVLVWATDGEASHPRSTAMSPAALGRVRRLESARAVARLGVQPAATHHLAMPDGRLELCREALTNALADIVCPGDLVLAPWSGDGHPDHDVVGTVAAELTGTTTWHYPIWMWHWATPADERVPWHKLRRVPVRDAAAKTAAIELFASQVRPIGSATADAAILPPNVVARFVRSSEWVIA